MDAGIYKITNLINGKVYVGQSVRLQQRLNDHRNRLKCNKHYNQHLQRSYNKYALENFKFEVIKYVDDRKDLAKWEEHFINLYISYDSEFGFNRTRYINEVPVPSDATRALWSKQRKGRPASELQKTAAGLAHKGKKLSKEHIAKVSKAQSKKKRALNTSGEANIHFDNKHNQYVIEFRINGNPFKVSGFKDIKEAVIIRDLFYSYNVNLLAEMKIIFNQTKTANGYFNVSKKGIRFESIIRSKEQPSTTIKRSKVKEECALAYNEYIINNKLDLPLNIIPFNPGTFEGNQWYCNLP